MEIKSATLKDAYLRAGLCGESNSGKTFSSLTVLKGLVGDLSRVVVIDTESRGNLYAKEFKGYKVLRLEAPFDPDKIVDALKMCAESKALGVVIDSGSDFWERTLAIHAQVAGTARNNFMAWAKVGPKWDAFKAAINNYPGHVISCWRTKDHIVQEGDKLKNIGKKVIGRGGMKGLKFEYQVIWNLGEDHKAMLVKDNTHQFGDWKESKLIDEGVGLKIKKWLVE